VHVHHFLNYKLCRAVDIFQNFCQPVAIQAVIHFLSKSEAAQNKRSADDFQFLTSCIFVSTSFFELLQLE
jgi:hypothetical protein